MLAHLPPELYACILDHVPDKQTVLALTRCLPYAGIPLDRLFHSIRITQPETVPLLYRRIRAPGASHLVCHLYVETWRVDADVLVNLLRLLPNLRTLTVWIGPSDISPEHLEEMFTPPMPNLEYLSLRFRPYVNKATYYQFHKGSYFDSTLHALSAWPTSPKRLSIVQDTPDTAAATPRFAQPIVFFRLDPSLSRLIHAHTALTALRIRIPTRPITHALTTAHARAPHLTFLDASTCSIAEPDVEALLMHHALRHLVLDACTGLCCAPDPEWWAALARRLVLAGLKKAREREKRIRAAYEAEYRLRVRCVAGNAAGGEGGEPQRHEPRRAKRGRRGLTSASVTLRQASPSPPPLRATTPAPPRAGPPVLPPKVHIIPTLPMLASLSLCPARTGGTAGMGAAARVAAQAAWARGWREGLRVLWDARARVGATFSRVGGAVPGVSGPGDGGGGGGVCGAG